MREKEKARWISKCTESVHSAFKAHNVLLASRQS